MEADLRDRSVYTQGAGANAISATTAVAAAAAVVAAAAVAATVARGRDATAAAHPTARAAAAAITAASLSFSVATAALADAAGLRRGGCDDWLRLGAARQIGHPQGTQWMGHAPYLHLLSLHHDAGMLLY